MYVDDTTLCCNISQNIGKEVINAQLVKLWDWLGANKLSLNIGKTKYLKVQYKFIEIQGIYTIKVTMAIYIIFFCFHSKLYL